MQKDREGASRVLLVLFRSLYGNNLVLEIAILLKYLFVGQILESTNIDTSIFPIIEKWLKGFAILFMTIFNLSKLKLLKLFLILIKIYLNSKSMTMEIVEVDLIKMIKKNQNLQQMENNKQKDLKVKTKLL